MAAAVNERLSLTRGYKCSDLTWKLLVLWKFVVEGRYSLRRRGRNWRLIIGCFMLYNLAVCMFSRD